MGALVEDLLLLARLDEKRPLGNDPVDLAELARDVLTELSAMFPSHRTIAEIDDAVRTIGDEHSTASGPRQPPRKCLRPHTAGHTCRTCG